MIDDGDLVVGTGLQDDAVGLQTLVLAPRQLALDRSGLIDQHTPQPIASRAALPKTQFDQPALPGEHLGREFATVFAGHRPFDAFDDGGDRRAIILELFGTVGHLNSRTATDVLVVGAFICILESAPTADVVDQNDLKIDVTGLDVFDQLLQCLSTVDAQTAFSFVGIGPNDLDAASSGVFPNLVGLVFG